MRPAQIPLQTPRQQQSRGGCLLRLVAIFALGGILVLAITAAFAPWGFYLGGKFHILPYWQGWGTAHAKAGDYVLFVRLEPTSGGKGTLGGSWVKGTAYLCTPRGEHFRMKLGGGMRKSLGLSTNGEAIHLWMFHWQWYGQFSADHRPSLDLRGHWQNPNLVMDDGGSFTRAFEADGTVYGGHDQNRPYSKDPLAITLVEGSYSDFEAACAAARR